MFVVDLGLGCFVVGWLCIGLMMVIVGVFDVLGVF